MTPIIVKIDLASNLKARSHQN